MLKIYNMRGLYGKVKYSGKGIYIADLTLSVKRFNPKKHTKICYFPKFTVAFRRIVDYFIKFDFGKFNRFIHAGCMEIPLYLFKSRGLAKLMARKPKRMALYEAIRQGQAKIAKGLESGQMRSDGRLYRKKESVPVPETNALSEEHEKSPGITTLSKTLALVSGLAVLVILLFGIWLGMHFADRSEPAAAPDESEMRALENAPDDPAGATEVNGSGTGLGSDTTARQPTGRTAAPASPEGANVIVIQQISPDQQDKLLPVKEYYDAKGVQTELIQRSGYALLVTRVGFDHNPNRAGTEGHRMIERIKQLGLAYPEATGDTKFGLRPFQDAYPLKR